MLIALWLVSVVLAVASLAVMAWLIIARLVTQSGHFNEEAKREALVGEIFRWLDRKDPDAEVNWPANFSLSVLSDLAAELLSVVKGEEQRRLIQLFTRAGLPAFLRRSLRTRIARK